MPVTFLDINYYLSFLFFFFAVFISFYIPGNVLLKKIDIEFFPRAVYSFGIGIVLWALQGFIFGYLGIRDLTYVYLLVFFVIWTYFLFKSRPLKIPKFKITKYDLPIILIFIVGVGIQMIFTFFNGVVYESGIRFCCDLPDNLYHIALTDSLVRNFPPYEPAMHGVIVKNYHYLANLASAEMIRVFHLPLIFTQYHFMALLVTILLGLSAICFSKIAKLNNVFIFFLLLFLFFIGDTTYILTYFAGKGINFNIPFLYDSTTLWFSPPRAYAIMLTFTALGLFYIWIKKYSFYLTIILSIIFASLIGFKIYNGAAIFVGLIFVTLYFLIKKDYRRGLLFISSLILGLLIYFSVNDGGSGLAYVGFWRVENFISQPDLGLSRMELARNIYKDGGNLAVSYGYDIYFTLLYFIFVFGSLNFAFFQTRKSLSIIPKEINLLLIPAIIVSLFLGFFTFQKIAGANTSQFIITAEIFMAIYAALSCAYLFKKFGKYKWIFLVFIILITTPRVINKTLKAVDELVHKDNYLVESKELSALYYLRDNSPKDSIILSDNDKLNASKMCYYIKFLSERNLFLCDQLGILGDHGVDFSSREVDYKKILSDPNDSNSHNLILNNKIDYLYLESNKSKRVYDDKVMESVFDNGHIKIMKVNRKH